MDSVKSLAQMNLETAKMQIPREEKTLNFWPRMKEFGSPLAIVGFGVAGHPRQLKVLHTKRPEKPIQALLQETAAPKSEAVCQKPFPGENEETTLNCGLKTKEDGKPVKFVRSEESGHMRHIKVLPYKQPLLPEAAAPKSEAVCQKPFHGGEEFEESRHPRKLEVLHTEQPQKPGEALLPQPPAPKSKPRKMAGFDDAKHQRLTHLRWKVHPARVLEKPDNTIQPLPLAPEKRGPAKAEDSSPAPQQTKGLGVGSLVEKFREYKEKKDQKRRQKAEEQYARWTAYKSRYPGMFSQQQNDAYASGFDAGRQGIFKSMF